MRAVRQVSIYSETFDDPEDLRSFGLNCTSRKDVRGTGRRRLAHALYSVRFTQRRASAIATAEKCKFPRAAPSKNKLTASSLIRNEAYSRQER